MHEVRWKRLAAAVVTSWSSVAGDMPLRFRTPGPGLPELDTSKTASHRLGNKGPRSRLANSATS